MELVNSAPHTSIHSIPYVLMYAVIFCSVMSANGGGLKGGRGVYVSSGLGVYEGEGGVWVWGLTVWVANLPVSC